MNSLSLKMRMAKPKVQNPHLLILLARAQVSPKLWTPDSLKVRHFASDLQRLYPTLHFWGRTMQHREPPVVSCLRCGAVHPPGHVVYDYFILHCKFCPGGWFDLPWRRRMDLEIIAKQVNWFMAFLSDLEYNYYCDEVLALWQANILNS